MRRQSDGMILRPVKRHRRPTRQQIARRRAFAALLVVAVLFAAWQFWPPDGKQHASGVPPTTASGHEGRTGTPVANGAGEPTTKSPIKHVVFIVKENRTFNNYFATYPGAVGSTTGPTLKCNGNTHTCRPGPTVQLKKAQDVQPHDITHAFNSGMYSVDGGKMDGFSIIGGGSDLSGYVYFDRTGIPNYWAYADRFVLADHFFTSMYGPTFPEHLYTVAAQADGVVDNKSTADHPGSYCSDPTEYTPHFDLSK